MTNTQNSARRKRGSEGYIHQRSYTRKMQDSGFARLTVWVPAQDVEELKNIASEMRSDHAKNR